MSDRNDGDDRACRTGTDLVPARPSAISDAVPSALSPQLEKYRHHVAHFDLPEERKAALIEAVWGIVRNFVDRAFGGDAAQLSHRDGDGSPGKDESAAPSVVEFGTTQVSQTNNTLSGTFRQHARNPRGKETR